MIDLKHLTGECAARMTKLAEEIDELLNDWKNATDTTYEVAARATRAQTGGGFSQVRNRGMSAVSNVDISLTKLAKELRATAGDFHTVPREFRAAGAVDDWSGVA